MDDKSHSVWSMLKIWTTWALIYSYNVHILSSKYQKRLLNSNFNLPYMKNDWGLILIWALLYIYYSILKRFLTWSLYTSSQIVFVHSLVETRSFVEKTEKFNELQLQQFSSWNLAHDLPLMSTKLSINFFSFRWIVIYLINP